MSNTKPIASAFLLALLTGCASAQSFVARSEAVKPSAMTPKNSAALPPLEYDKPYPGPLIVTRGDERLMRQLCPKTTMPITLGCKYLLQLPQTEAKHPACWIVIANDEILKEAGWPYDIVKRHEVAHCGGWPADQAAIETTRMAAFAKE
jgi:hypothetical protein